MPNAYHQVLLSSESRELTAFSGTTSPPSSPIWNGSSSYSRQPAERSQLSNALSSPSRLNISVTSSTEPASVLPRLPSRLSPTFPNHKRCKNCNDSSAWELMFGSSSPDLLSSSIVYVPWFRQSTTNKRRSRSPPKRDKLSTSSSKPFLTTLDSRALFLVDTRKFLRMHPPLPSARS